MEQGRPGPEFSDENARLAKQINDILADVTDEDVRDQLLDIDLRDLQRSREAAMVAEITGLLDGHIAAKFNALYGDTVGSRRALEAIDVMRSLESYDQIDALSDDQLYDFHVMVSLNRIVLDASFTEQNIDGTHQFGMHKPDVQLVILTDDIFAPKLKVDLIAMIDRMMPGEPLDMTDPGAVANALRQRSEAKKSALERTHRRQIVSSELLRFAHFDDHPDFDGVMSDLRAAVSNGESIARVVHTFARDQRLGAIGIHTDDFITAIVDIYTLLNED